MEDLVEIEYLFGKESQSGIENCLNDLARLRIEVFKEFPYLYDGNLNYEMNYLKTYVQSPSSIVILAKLKGKVIGASTGVAMKEESNEFKNPFLKEGFNLETLFYCGESILKKEYRGHGIYRKFFEGREKHARNLGGVEHCVFCSVQRPLDHPLRPKDYTPLNSVWQRFGYQECPTIRTNYRWKDVDEKFETDKEMIFWMKRIK